MTPTLQILVWLALALGLAVGSFLNVVIFRLPNWLMHQWQREACEILEQAPSSETVPNLAFPASHCPICEHPLKWWHNIPLISYLILRGRCAFCRTRISPQYPFVEALNAFWWAFCMYQAQGDWHTALWWSAWGSTLITLTWIDAQTMLLPDVLTLPLLWGALVVSTLGLTHLSAAEAIWGAALGYVFLWAPALIYQRLKGHMGMAPGDFKLLAAIGASLGPMALPSTLLIASLIGLLFGGWYFWRQRQASSGAFESQPIPFGPALALAAALQHSFGFDFALQW